MTDTVATLPFEITVDVDGQARSIFMSFALLNRCCYLMGDSTQIPLILQDPELREAILVEVLSERDKFGKVISRKGMDEMTISFGHIQDLLEFVSEHVADFTVAAVERANRVMESRKARIDAIAKPLSSTPTPTGPESSPSKSPAA